MNGSTPEITPGAPPPQKKGFNPLLLVVGLVGCGLIFIAVSGIIAAIFIPNFLDALQKAKQKRTLADVRIVGMAYDAMLTDIEAQGTSLGLDGIVSGEELALLLEPNYIHQLPTTDAWGFPFEYWVSGDLDADHLFRIRSPGRDGVFNDDAWAEGAFDRHDYDQDIVFADGKFLRYPQLATP